MNCALFIKHLKFKFPQMRWKFTGVGTDRRWIGTYRYNQVICWVYNEDIGFYNDFILLKNKIQAFYGFYNRRCLKELILRINT